MLEQPDIELEGVAEYAEGLPVVLGTVDDTLVFSAGTTPYDFVSIDALQLLGWIKRNRPELWGMV